MSHSPSDVLPSAERVRVADRSEKLFKLGVCFYIVGLAVALTGVAVLGRLISVADPSELGSVILIVGLGLMGCGWIMRKNMRSS